MGYKRSPRIDPKKGAGDEHSGKWVSSEMPSRRLIIAILLFAGVIWYGFYATHTKEISGSDDREYASIARNIVDGKGIVRNFIYPVDINFFKKLPVPEFVHPPGYPLIIAGFFKLFGISDLSALLPSYLSYFILVILIFLFARRHLGVRTATVAAVILIFSKEILNMSMVALSEMVYALFFFLFFTLFVKASSLKAIFIAGILLGMSHLIRENIYPFVIPLFIYLYFYPDFPRWKKMFFFLIGIFMPIIPNMIRSFSLTGSPFFSYGKFALMAFSEKYPWLNIYRDTENLSLFEFLSAEAAQLYLKYLTNVVSTFEQFMSVSNPYVLAFFVIEMFHWKMSQEWKRVKLLFLFLLVSQIFFISLFTFTHRFFVPFLPMMILFASQGFSRISEELIPEVRVHWKKVVFLSTILLFFIFFMVPTTYTIFQPKKSPIFNFRNPQFGFLISKGEAEKLKEFLKDELKENQVIWTDLPEILEWEGNRLCGWLPIRIETIYKIHKKIPVDAILLTSIRTPYTMEEEWRYLLLSEHSLPKYRNVKLYKSRWVFAKLLVRDEEE